MFGSGFMKHGAELTANNRTILKRNGRFSPPKNMFDQLKYREDRKSELLKFKESRPELVAAVKKQMRLDKKESRRWDILIGIICLGFLVGFVCWLLL